MAEDRSGILLMCPQFSRPVLDICYTPTPTPGHHRPRCLHPPCLPPYHPRPYTTSTAPCRRLRPPPRRLCPRIRPRPSS